MATLIQDMRYGIRMLVKSPAFTAVAVLTLALGIAVNTAMFSVTNATLLRMPFPNPQELVVVSNTYPGGSEGTPVSYPDFQEWRKQSRAFSELTAFFPISLNYVGGHEPQNITGALVAEDYFKTLGIFAIRGRTFTAADHRADAAPVCVLSAAFWQREFGSDPAIIGKTLPLNGAAYTVVGVLPAEAPVLRSEEIWTPLEANIPWKIRGTNYLRIIGRLKPGVAIDAARGDVDTIQQRINQEFPKNQHGIRVAPLADILVGEIRPVLLVLLAAVGFVLLIACANVANLLLTRAAARTREFAVRRALGASPLRIARQMLTESLVLALAGGTLGMALAMWLAQLPLRFWPAEMRGRPHGIPIDGRVLAFTIAASLLAGVLFGVAPALRGFAQDFNSALKEGSGQAGDSRGQRRTRELLVICEVALAMVLAAGAVLTLRSFSVLVNTDPGFSPRQLLTMRVALSPLHYKESAQRLQFLNQVQERLATIPGVKSVGAVTGVPLSGSSRSQDFNIEGRPPFPSDQSPFADFSFVTPTYFQTMGIPVIRGRGFTELDTESTPKVVIINETMARRFWPKGDAIGHRIGGTTQWWQIIGVVGDIKDEALEQDAGLQLYYSASQAWWPNWSFVIRGAVDPATLIETAKRAVYDVDSQQPISDVSLMDQMISRSIGRERASTFLLGAFGSLALLLAIIGIYGVIAYTVAERTRELGIRMALGAGRNEILSMVLGLGARLACIGALLGVIAAVVITRALRSVLFGIGGFDAIAFAVAAGSVMAAALLATYLPARRATRVDPMVALRYE